MDENPYMSPIKRATSAAHVNRSSIVRILGLVLYYTPYICLLAVLTVIGVLLKLAQSDPDSFDVFGNFLEFIQPILLPATILAGASVIIGTVLRIYDAKRRSVSPATGANEDESPPTLQSKTAATAPEPDLSVSLGAGRSHRR